MQVHTLFKIYYDITSFFLNVYGKLE